MAAIYELIVRVEFSASHALRHYQGKCEALHGHNFGVEVAVRGRDLAPRTGLLLDFGILKDHTRQVLAELDHTHLNDLPAFREANPSSEHLARHIHDRLKERLAAYPVRLWRVTVSETSAQSASYMED